MTDDRSAPDEELDTAVQPDDDEDDTAGHIEPSRLPRDLGDRPRPQPVD